MAMATSKASRTKAKAKKGQAQGQGKTKYAKGTAAVSVYTRLKAFRAQLRVGDEVCFELEEGQYVWGRVAYIATPQRTIMWIWIYTTLGEWASQDWPRVCDVRTEIDEAIRLSWAASLTKKWEVRRARIEAEGAVDDY